MACDHKHEVATVHCIATMYRFMYASIQGTVYYTAEATDAVFSQMQSSRANSC